MSRPLTGRLVTGGLIVLVGLLLLATTTGVARVDSVWAWLPAVFVLLGAWALLRSEFRNLTGPVMIIAIAGTFLLRNLGLVSDGSIGTWWPLFVVLFGLLVVVSRSRRRRRVQLTGVDGEVTGVAIFGDSRRRFTGDQFGGGELVSVFGDVDVDLRDVGRQLVPAIIETVTVFGDTELTVPEEWSVRFEVVSLFGSAHDTRTDAKSSGDPDLIVTGIALFGDVEVRD